MESIQLLNEEKVLSVLRRQKYQVVGAHSSVKKCHWFHQSLVSKRPCYKQKFYGIKSHRCLQMTPATIYCTLRCKFCWRVQPSDINIQWAELGRNFWDEPSFIVEESIKAQRRILTGYKVHPKVDRQMWEEAYNPRHAAISLSGEPTVYPYLSDLIYEFHKRGFTTFLVTNGNLPEALENLEHEPTQLYLSIQAPNKEVYLKLCRPLIPHAWEKFNESLELLKTFSCPTVLRLTAVKGYNMIDPEGYAELIDKADATYVEVKSYMHVGFSRGRLRYENMPTHTDIKNFALELSRLTGYKIVDESPESRVVLLSKLDKPIKLA